MDGTAMTGLSPVDQIDVVVLVDNVIDYASFLDRPDVLRPQQWRSERPKTRGHLWASHGLSMLVTTYSGDSTHTTLYDTGASDTILEHNTTLLDVDLQNVESIAISHGHWDHMGGLLFALSRIGRKGIPIHIHPIAFDKRAVARKDGKLRELDAVPAREEIQSRGGDIRISTNPVALHDDQILLSGEIPRTTNYEKGFAGHRTLQEGKWEKDELIPDDRFLVANVKDKGLVIVTGCSHSGIVNVVRHAVELTGIQQVYGIIGGFHLVGKLNEERIEETVRDLQKFNPKLIVPAHCTGWRAQRALASAMPDAFVNGSVGNLYRI
jgi:7,8-dihydropterin-6-yl-methyl-4-(beta-D-ribofuranosyl)aminobenzene 5'-phosphate synthase